MADAEKAELEIGVRADPLVRRCWNDSPERRLSACAAEGCGAGAVGLRAADVPLPDDSGFGDNWERDDE